MYEFLATTPYSLCRLGVLRANGADAVSRCVEDVSL